MLSKMAAMGALQKRLSNKWIIDDPAPNGQLAGLKLSSFT